MPRHDQTPGRVPEPYGADSVEYLAHMKLTLQCVFNAARAGTPRASVHVHSEKRGDALTLTLVVAVTEFFVVVGVALAAVLLSTIDARGFLASVAVGLAIIYGGGLQWFVIVAVFFILGVAFTLYKYGYKKKIGGAQDKGGARNWPNILANGGFASIVAVWNFVGPSPALAAMFLGAISASAADTAATELGLLSHSRPRLITHPSKGGPP